jgi:hypothetical protein
VRGRVDLDWVARANRYAAFISNEALVGDLRKRFEALTGPVRKTGGVR